MTITHQELARRLRAAREAGGYTQDDVARVLGVSRSTVAQLEAGKRKISSLELDKIARLFGRSMIDFFADEFVEDGVAVIMRELADARKDPAVQEELARALTVAREIVDLEEILGIKALPPALPAYTTRKPRSVWNAVLEGSRVAEQERRRLQLGTDPVEDLSAVLENQGVLVLELGLPTTISGFTFRFDHHLACGVNTNHHVSRQRYSLAHELCHALCDIGAAEGIISREHGGKDLRETRANAFAAGFLMPDERVTGFLEGLGKGLPRQLESEKGSARRRKSAAEIDLWDVVGLARFFGVSREAAIWRLKALGLIDERQRKRLASEAEAGLGPRLDRRLQVAETMPEYGAKDPDAGRLKRSETRLLLLAREALQQDEISRRRFIELAELAGLAAEEIAEIPLARRVHE